MITAILIAWLFGGLLGWKLPFKKKKQPTNIEDLIGHLQDEYERNKNLNISYRQVKNVEMAKYFQGKCSAISECIKLVKQIKM